MLYRRVDRSLYLRCDRCDNRDREQYLAPGGQVELDSAKPSPPGQDQVLSLGTRELWKH